MILVVDNYDSFTYNLVQLLAALGAEPHVERNDSMSAEEMLALGPRGVVISPGPGRPEEAGVSKEIVRLAADRRLPLLGVCLGHQCVGEVFGAEVVRAPAPIHGKTADVSHDGRGLLEGMPDPFTATRYHSLVVDALSVTDPLEVVASTEDGLVMAIRHRSLPIHGVQFHPESVLTPEGAVVLRNFLYETGEIRGERAQCGAQEGAPSGDPGPQQVSQPAAVAASNESAAPPVRDAIAKVAGGEPLSEDEAFAAMGAIMDGEATPAQISSLVTAMRMKGETADEITGFARAMRERAVPVRPGVERYVDTCGTGGDGLATFNISTATAFVVAGAGVAIAKHGNRAVSSASGSADVLEALGVRIDLSPQDVARCIDEVGVGFLFAQALHSSMRHAAGPRREIAIRTVFNILGPLTNPAGAKRQLLGVYSPELVPVLAEVAGRLGAQRVLVVHGHPGMDEVSASGPTLVGDYADGEVRAYELTPERVGVARGSAADLAGGDPAANARAIRSILGGEHGGKRDVVLMNAAATLVASGAAGDFAEGVVMARRSLDSGRAQASLEALTAVSARMARDAEAPRRAEGAASTRGQRPAGEAAS